MEFDGIFDKKVTVENTEQTPNFIQNLKNLAPTEPVQHKYRFTKLIYCDCGLINFLKSLTGIMSQKNIEKMNYYFVLKREIKRMKQQAS